MKKYLEIENSNIDAFNEYYKCFDQETGEQIVEDEVLEEVQNKIMESKEEATGYIEHFLSKHREQEARILGISEEIKRLQKILKREKSIKEKDGNFIGLIAKKLFNGKFTGAFSSVSFSKSTGLVVDDESMVEKRFMIEEISISKIKAAILAGENIPYAHIEERENLQIK